MIIFSAAAALAQDAPPKPATNDLLKELIDSVVALREAPGVHGVEDVMTRLRNRKLGPPPESMEERIAYARETDPILDQSPCLRVARRLIASLVAGISSSAPAHNLRNVSYSRIAELTSFVNS